MQLNFPRVFPESKTKFTCFINLSWSKDFPPVDTNMEIHKNWREHWNTEIQIFRKAKILEYKNTEIYMFSWSVACAPSLASSSSLCPFPLWWTGHISTKPKMHHSSTIIKNNHQSWPIKTISRALFFWLRLSRPWNRVDLREIPLSWKLDESENRDFDGLTLLNLCPQQSPFSNHTKWILFLHVALQLNTKKTFCLPS